MNLFQLNFEQYNDIVMLKKIKTKNSDTLASVHIAGTVIGFIIYRETTTRTDKKSGKKIANKPFFKLETIKYHAKNREVKYDHFLSFDCDPEIPYSCYYTLEEALCHFND